MTVQLPDAGRGFADDKLIANWSRIDPVAASRFVEKYRFAEGVTVPGEENGRVVSLLNNWGEIEPTASRKCLEEEKRHLLEIVAAAKPKRDQEEAEREERERAEEDQGSDK